MRLSAEATPAACRSPEASPATNSTLRMMLRVSDQRRQSELYFLDDAECDAERQSSFFSSHDHFAPSLERDDEAFQLQLERLAVGRIELDAVHVGGDVRRRRANRERIDVGAKSEKLS